VHNNKPSRFVSAGVLQDCTVIFSTEILKLQVVIISGCGY